VYNQLKRMAWGFRLYVKNERPGNTLQTNGLVNEVYLRLVDVKNVDWQHRARFLAIFRANDAKHFSGCRARPRLAQARRRAVKVNVEQTAFITRAGRFSHCIARGAAGVREPGARYAKLSSRRIE
jgi:hypothetical protein